MTPSPSCGCKIIEIRRSARFKDGLAKIDYCPTHAQAFALRDTLKRTRGVVDLIAGTYGEQTVKQSAKKLLAEIDKLLSEVSDDE